MAPSDFTVTATDGRLLDSPTGQSESSGSNFFTFTTDLGTRLLDVYLKADVPIAFTDAAQFRIGGGRGQETTAVPEPASLLLFGTALAGVGWRISAGAWPPSAETGTR